MLGDAVSSGGIVTAHPSMDPAHLDEHDELPRTADFRDIFGTVAARWYGGNATPLFPNYTYTDLGFLP